MGSRKVIQDALDRWAMDGVLRIKAHGLRSCREALPHITGGALCVCYIGQRIESEAQFVVIDEVFVETQFFVTLIGELAASRSELLSHYGPGLRKLLRHEDIFSVLIWFGLRFQRRLCRVERDRALMPRCAGCRALVAPIMLAQVGSSGNEIKGTVGRGTLGEIRAGPPRQRPDLSPGGGACEPGTTFWRSVASTWWTSRTGSSQWSSNSSCVSGCRRCCGSPLR